MDNEWIKQNDEPIEIEYVDGGHNFWYNDRFYDLNNFLICHNAWMGDTFPEFIHGVELENYYDPIFIELVDGDTVNVWREV